MRPLTKSSLKFAVHQIILHGLILWLIHWFSNTSTHPFYSKINLTFWITYLGLLTLVQHYKTDEDLMELGIYTPTESHFQRLQTKTIHNERSKDELLVLLKQQDWLKTIQLSDDGQQIVAKNRIGWKIFSLNIKKETLIISSRSPIPLEGLAAIRSLKNIHRLEKLIHNAQSP